MESNVVHPDHYTGFPMEVINIIKAVLGNDGFKNYCFGNEIKYRMRAGLKGDNADEDIKKAMMYKKFRDSTLTTTESKEDGHYTEKYYTR